MSQQLLVLRGVQGSGKSDFAMKWVAQDPHNRARVNRDDIRMAQFGAYQLSPELENVVTKVEHAMILALLRARKSVVVDNVNLRAKYVKEYLKIAEKTHVVTIYKDFPIELDEALKRNAARERVVPQSVIETTYRKYIHSGKFPPFPYLGEEDYKAVYVPDESLPKAVLLDVDGTAMKLAEHRGPFDWDKVLDDTPNLPVIETALALHARGYKIVVMSGRSDICKEDTLLSLEIAGIPVHEIHMRKDGDYRKDSIVKRELFDEHIRNRFNILLALDDRDSVVELYRNDLKVPVFQVDYGDF